MRLASGQLIAHLAFNVTQVTQSATSSLTTLVRDTVTVLGLLGVGAVKTWATRGRPVRSALENLAVATLGGGLGLESGPAAGDDDLPRAFARCPTRTT